ncbi:MAG: NAD(P)H-binding protein [Anaerolineaceae bacterium]
MILVTGGTGFIGGELIKQLVALGQPFRLLIQPSKKPPTLPMGVNLDVAVSSLTDERGIKAALQDVDVIYHLSGVEQTASFVDLQQVEVAGVDSLTRAAKQTKVERFFYLSHLGADRASAFQLMKAKGIAEYIIKNSGLNYTIIRSSMIYGRGDIFTQNLAKLIKISPGVVAIPGDGSVLLQPIWVEDLTTCLVWALDLPDTENNIIEIGGPEHLSFKDILQMIAGVTGKKRNFVEFNPVRLGTLIQVMETLVKNFPSSPFWMDYLAENRICALDSIPRTFGLNPSRFHQKLDYLISGKSTT